ncbi:hypothetical protein YC2023_113366 [Brassica napus]
MRREEMEHCREISLNAGYWRSERRHQRLVREEGNRRLIVLRQNVLAETCAYYDHYQNVFQRT